MKYSREEYEAIMARAYELVSDEHRAQHEREHAAWVEKHEAELLDVETDRLLEQRREAEQPSFRMLYRTYDPGPQRQESSVYMDEAQQKLWDHWVHRHIQNSLTSFGGELAEIFGGEAGQLERRLLNRIEKIEAENAALRAEIEILRAHKASADVVDIKGKHVA